MKYTYLLAVILLAGCAGQINEPNHYLLRGAQSPESRQLSPSREYSIGNVAIASYIDQPGLVLETESGAVQTARGHLWAEPVYEGIRNYLMTGIAQARGEDILPHSIAPTPVVIDIHIDQLHGTNQGSATLVAYWWLRRSGELLAAHQFSQQEALAEDGYIELVRAEKNLLTQLANKIAASMVD